jgi:ribose transport system permease protein
MRSNNYTDVTFYSKNKITFGKIFFRNEIILLLWIVFAGILLSILSPNFSTLNNFLNIINQAVIIAIISVGMTLVITSGNGGIDLSVGSIVGISSITLGIIIVPPSINTDTAAILAAGKNPMVLLAAVFGAMAIGTVVGAVNGVIIAYLKVPPFITTLGMLYMARGIAAYIGAGYPVYGVPEPIKFIGQGNIFHIPIPIILLILIGIAGYLFYSRTTFGIAVRAIGANNQTALFSGINVKRTQLILYVVNGFLSSIGAIILTGRTNVAHPDSGLGYELFVIGAVVVGGTSLMGGKGNILGAIFGALFMSELQNGMNILNVPINLIEPIIGVVIIIAIFLDQIQKRRKGMY